MALPAQVEQDLKDIEELEKQLTAQNAEPKDTPPEPEADTVDETPPPNSQEPDPTELEKPPLEVVPQQTEDFEQKYDTLRGKYDTEVPRLHAQVRDLMQKVEELTTTINAKPEPAPEHEPEPTTYVTDADRENFGEDLLDVQRRVAEEVGAKYESKIAKLEAVIGTLTQRVDDTGGQMTEMTFEQRLGRLVPDFDALNTDPKWVAWLDVVDPIVRGPRRNMAQQAFAEGDAQAVADYVKLFKAEQAAVNKQTPLETEMEKQVTPSRNNTSTVPTHQKDGLATYTQAQMNAAWDQITVLNKAGRFDEADTLEAEISAAMLEGRAEM